MGVSDAKTGGCPLFLCGLLIGLGGGCGRISIVPSCPSELGIGESAMVSANARNTGAVPTYAWEADPFTGGTFGDPSLATTLFRADREGVVTLRLTAADGLFQDVDECQVQVVTVGQMAVSLQVSPDPPVAGQAATLTCSSVGVIDAVTRSIEHVSGGDVSILNAIDGLINFVPSEAGVLTFQCTGTSADGDRSVLATVDITVSDTDDSDRPSRPGRG